MTEQHYCIKFFQKLDDSQVEAIQKIQMAYSDDAIGVTQIKEWCKWFKDTCSSVDSKPLSSMSSKGWNDQVIAKVIVVVKRDRHVTIREIAEEVDISTFLAHSFLTEDLTMKRVAAKFVHILQT